MMVYSIIIFSIGYVLEAIMLYTLIRKYRKALGYNPDPLGGKDEDKSNT